MQMLKSNPTIKELYLSWNQFSFKGGINLLTGLEEKKNLAVLDLSHNNIGQSSRNKVDLSFVNAFCKLIPSIYLLQHIDLSDNNFLYEESILISKELRRNHTLLGFHFSGNNAYIDSQLFLKIIPLKNEEKYNTGQY